MSNRPVLSVTFKRGDTNYSVISVWAGPYPGTYSLSRDKGSDQYPAISIIEVLKSFAAGDGYVNIRVPSQTEQRGGGGSRGGGGHSASQGAGDFDDDTPF